MFLFSAIYDRETSFTIIQKKKTPFRAIKTKSSKSRKIEIFPKGLVHGFGQNWPFFHPFFPAILARKLSFTIVQNKKTLFQAIKTKSSKSRKIEIFQKGLVHGFGQNSPFFHLFIFGNIGQKNIFYDSLEEENAFLDYKNKKIKKSKN